MKKNIVTTHFVAGNAKSELSGQYKAKGGKQIQNILLLLVLCGLLQGCVAAFVAGAAAGGSAVYDRNNLKSMFKDKDIIANINSKIYQDSELYHKSHIVVGVYHRVVLLTGQTPFSAARDRVVEIARTTPGVEKVYNEITISSPSAFTTRTSDTWITTKVRSAMLSTKGLHSSKIKVVTENGIVYLMGNVAADQADLAVDCTRRVYGVQKVVKLFQSSN